MSVSRHTIEQINALIAEQDLEAALNSGQVIAEQIAYAKKQAYLTVLELIEKQQDSSKINTFYCYAKIYEQWAVYAEEEARADILMVERYHNSGRYHQVKLIASPKQMDKLLLEHQRLLHA